MLRIILGVILVVSAGWIMLLATGWELPYEYSLSLIQLLRTTPWQSLIFALLTLFLGWFLLRDSLPQRGKKLIIKTESGELRITQAAIEDLIKRSTAGIGGLKSIKSKFKQSEEGLEIYLTCQVEDNFDFTKVSLKIQETVKKTIEQYSGIMVKEVRVLIQPVPIGSRSALQK